MQIKFLATGNSPTCYSISSEVITAFYNEASESFDLSALETNGKFTGVGVDTLSLNSQHIIRDAYRDDAGELHVTLCQAVGPGNWGESQEFDSSDYDPDVIHVEFKGAMAGTPWALTRRGKVNPETGEVI